MKKITMSLNDFVDALKKINVNQRFDIAEQIDELSTSKDLKEDILALFNNTPGGLVKGFLKECGFPEHEINIASKKKHLDIFENYVEVTNGQVSNTPESNDDNEKESVEEEVVMSNEQYTLTKAQSLFERIRSKLKEDKSIRALNQFELYADVPITFSDGFKIQKTRNHDFARSLCMIIGKNDTVVAVGKLVTDSTGDYRIVINNDAESIRYDGFRNFAKFRIILFEKNEEGVLNEFLESGSFSGISNAYAVNSRLHISDLQVTDKPLCIDFGTSNTTAGTYGLRSDDPDDIVGVEFEYKAGNTISTKKVLPTMAYVKSCENLDQIEYLFGYEAEEKIIACKYDTEATVFFEMKRWITELDKKEELYDEEGCCCEDVDRSSIIKAYLKYVITKAEQFFKVKFKEVHFSAPVKIKKTYIAALKKMLPEYTVYASSKCLDEGIAIVYDYIANQIDESLEKNRHNDDSYENREKTSVLVLDCGGGTTDLVNCEYSYETESNESDAVLKVNTRFENGNANFGGNNITFRILQLLKIKMVDALYENALEYGSRIDNLIVESDSKMLDIIDSNMNSGNRPLTGSIYDRFEETYAKCEEYIPTRFADSDFYKSESKRNYFYLWQLAERMKKKFYESGNMATYNLEKRIAVEDIKDFYLYRYNEESDSIEKADSVPDIEVTNNEIRKVVYADIYSVMNDLFNDIDMKSFDKYKLSGQSCKVTLFQELLKEFITGRKLRETNMQAEGAKAVENLKMGCINGCIAFTRGIKRGEIISKVNRPKNPPLLYSVDIITKDRTTILEPNKPYGGKPFNMKADALKIEVRNMQNDLSRPVFEYKPSTKFSGKITMNDVRDMIEKHSAITAENLEILRQKIEACAFESVDKGVYIVFATVAKDGYGFNLFHLCVDEDSDGSRMYRFPEASDGNVYEPQYENFESINASFFDGHR